MNGPTVRRLIAADRSPDPGSLDRGGKPIGPATLLLPH